MKGAVCVIGGGRVGLYLFDVISGEGVDPGFKPTFISFYRNITYLTALCVCVRERDRE